MKESVVLICPLFFISFILLSSLVCAVDSSATAVKCSSCGSQETPLNWEVTVNGITPCSSAYSKFFTDNINGKTFDVKQDSGAVTGSVVPCWWEGKSVNFLAPTGKSVYLDVFASTMSGMGVVITINSAQDHSILGYLFNGQSTLNCAQTLSLTKNSYDTNPTCNPSAAGYAGVLNSLGGKGGIVSITPAPIGPEGDTGVTGDTGYGNAQPSIIAALPKVIYIDEKDNVLSLTKMTSAQKTIGRMTINSIVYGVPDIWDKETAVEKLALQIGSTKMTANPSPKVTFSSADIGLAYTELPKLANFSLIVTDDGTNGLGEKVQPENNRLRGSVIWCPTIVNLVASYDIPINARKKLLTFSEGELIVEEQLKEMTANIKFFGPTIKGKFTIHILSKLPDSAADWKLSLPSVDAKRKAAIEKVQKDIVTSTGLDLGKPDFLSSWGWDSGIFSSNYHTLSLDFTLEYDFETQKLTITGGSGDKTDSIVKDLSVEGFAKLVGAVSQDRPSQLEEANPDGKEGDPLAKDWKKAGSGIKNPSDMDKEFQKLISYCYQKAPEKVSIDSSKEALTQEGLASYYFIQKSSNQSKKGNAIKISMDPPVNISIIKSFYYKQFGFSDPDSIGLYRYGDEEIENGCKIVVLNETRFNVTSSGGVFETQKVEITIPDNFENTNLTIQEVLIGNCPNLQETRVKEVIDFIRQYYHHENDLPTVINRIAKWKN